MNRARVVVIGGGAVGFSTAVCIAETLLSSFVTLVAEKFSPDTTSDVAAGILFTSNFPDVPLERQKRWLQDSFDHLLAIAQSEHASEAGVMLISGCQIFREIPADWKPYWSEILIGFRTMTELELKRFPEHKFGQVFTTLKSECPTYLPWLQQRFMKAGGRVQQRKINSLHELEDYDVIVNCAALGSTALTGDTQIHPVRGQVLKVEAPWLKHFIRDGDGKTYIFPGIDSVTIGGTRQVGDWRLEADEDDSRGILQRCIKLEPSLTKARVLDTCVGLRPTRTSPSPRLERDVVQLHGRRVPLVHNYGHGGWGVGLAWGTAVEATQLVRQCLNEGPLPAKM